MLNRKNQGVLAEHYEKMVAHDDEEAQDAEFFTLKRVDHNLEEQATEQEFIQSKNKLKKVTRKLAIQQNPKGEKTVFDDDGNVAMKSLIILDATLLPTKE